MWQILPIMPSSALWQIDSAPEGACAEVPDASDWWAFFALHSLTFLKEGRSDTCQRKDSEESCWVRDASSVLYLHSQVCVPHLPQHRGSFWMDFLSPQLAQSCFFLTSFFFFFVFLFICCTTIPFRYRVHWWKTFREVAEADRISLTLSF